MTSSGSSIPDYADMAADAKAWRKEKTCFLCQAPLGHGLLRAKKHGCKVCGHAVCTSCSPNRKTNPRSKKPQRICTSCEENFEIEDAPGKFLSPGIDILTATEDKLKLETELRQSVECKYAVSETARCKAAKEMQEINEKCSKNEILIADLTNLLNLEREKVGKMNEFIGKICEKVLGKTGNSEELWSEIDEKLTNFAEFLLEKEKICSKSLNLESFRVIQLPSTSQISVKSREKTAVSTCKMVETTSILPLPRHHVHLSLDSASISIPTTFPTSPQLSTLTPCPVDERKSASFCSESPEKCLKCAELTSEIMKLRSEMSHLHHSGKKGSQILGSRSNQVCQCTTS